MNMNQIEIEGIKKRFPLFSSKVLIDLVNGIDVSKEIIHYRKNSGLGRVFIDKLAGNNQKRQELLNGNLVEGHSALFQWLLELSRDNTISHTALQYTQKKLLETRDTIAEAKSEIKDFRQELDKLANTFQTKLDNFETYIKYEDIIREWKVGNIYNNTPWAMQVALLAQELFTLCTNYQMQDSVWKEYSQRLINDFLIETKKDFPEHFFSLQTLLELSLEEMKKSSEVHLVAWLLEIKPLIETDFAIRPYLFAIAKTLQLATLQDEQVNPAQEALNITRELTFIPSAIDIKVFVEAVVNETLDKYLAIARKEQANSAIPPSGDTMLNSGVNQRIQIPVNSSQGLELIDVETNKPKFGLVLAGGGAKGAYQVGVLKYLSEKLNFKPDMIAGTSIGALNGSFLASHQPFDLAVKSLEDVWDKIGREGILKRKINLANGFSIFDPEPIEKLLKTHVKVNALQCGIKLWVTVFPSLNTPIGILDYLRSLIDSRGNDTSTSAQWKCVNNLNDQDTVRKSILASAAIPLLFPRQEINGDSFVDGFLGDNIPLRAFAKQECTCVIVIHLDNGETWSRHNFPNQQIIEIRPKLKINQKSFLTALDFSAENISKLKQRGEEDARIYLEPIILTLITEAERRDSLDSLIESTRRL